MDRAHLERDEAIMLVVDRLEDAAFTTLADDLDRLVPLTQQHGHFNPPAAATLFDTTCRLRSRGVERSGADVEVWQLSGRSVVALEGDRVTVGKAAENAISI